MLNLRTLERMTRERRVGNVGQHYHPWTLVKQYSNSLKSVWRTSWTRCFSAFDFFESLARSCFKPICSILARRWLEYSTIFVVTYHVNVMCCFHCFRAEFVRSSTKKECQWLFKAATMWSLQVTSLMWKPLLENLDLKNSSGTIRLWATSCLLQWFA